MIGHPRSLRLEPLESRNLLSVTLASGVLNVTGTNRADHVEIKFENNQLAVSVNNAKSLFDAAGVQKIEVFGLKGNDSIQIADDVAIDAYIEGGAGNDRILGGGGNDEIHGGAGNDRIVGGAGNDAIFGEMGNDRVNGGIGDDEIHGGAGNDQLAGDAADDELFGDAGNDKLDGDDGDDLVHGGAGADAVFGSLGDDDLFGDAGNDNLHGEDGSDDLYGGIGHDRLYGGAGDDSLHGDAGNDLLDGEDGNNLLDGDQGKDHERNGQSVDFETELRAVLTADNGMKVKAEYESETEDGGVSSELKIKVEGGTSGETLDVLVGGTQVGSITIDADGKGRLILSSHPEHDGELPLPDGLVIAVDTTIQVGTLQGTFQTSPS